MNDKQASTTARVDFRLENEHEIAASISLSEPASELVNSPEKLRALMEMLNLPKGTTATVVVSVSSTIVR